MGRRSERGLNEALELLHFGFRAIVRRPDRDLGRLGLGRVHHRTLYFVGRNEGIAIGALVRVLGVTKQALHRPLAELVGARFIDREPDPDNRRIVRLRLSRAGSKLEQRLSGAQRAHFARAFASVGPNAERGWRSVMQQLAIDEAR